MCSPQKQMFTDVLQNGLKDCNFIKKRLLCRYFPVKFVRFLRTYFLQKTSGVCFCPQNGLKETKRYSKKRYSRNTFFKTITQRNGSNYKISWKCFLIMKYYHSEVMKNQCGKT